MKYFTMKWWLALQNDMPKKEERRPQKEYDRYYASVKKQLPKQFVDFQKAYSLHDAILIFLSFNPKKQRLRIEFMLDIVHKDSIEYQVGTLTYSGVTDFGNSRREKLTDSDPTDYEYLLADEIEVVGTKIFEHRILFSSNIEFNITFTGFKFSIED